MEGAGRSEGDDVESGGPVVKKASSYLLFQNALRDDMVRKFGGKDVFNQYLQEKHGVEGSSRAAIVCCTAGKMWAEAPPGVREFFEHARNIHMAWMARVQAPEKAGKAKDDVDRSKKVGEAGTPTTQPKPSGGGAKRRKESLPACGPIDEAVAASAQAQGKVPNGAPAVKLVARKALPADSNAGMSGKAAGSSTKGTVSTGPTPSSGISVARRDPASSARTVAPAAAPACAEAKHPAATAAAAVFPAPEAKAGDSKEALAKSRSDRAGIAGSDAPGRSLGPAQKGKQPETSGAAAALSLPAAKDNCRKETGTQNRGELVTTGQSTTSGRPSSSAHKAIHPAEVASATVSSSRTAKSGGSTESGVQGRGGQVGMGASVNPINAAAEIPLGSFKRAKQQQPGATAAAPVSSPPATKGGGGKESGAQTKSARVGAPRVEARASIVPVILGKPSGAAKQAKRPVEVSSPASLSKPTVKDGGGGKDSDAPTRNASRAPSGAPVNPSIPGKVSGAAQETKHPAEVARCTSGKESATQNKSGRVGAGASNVPGVMLGSAQKAKPLAEVVKTTVLSTSAAKAGGGKDSGKDIRRGQDERMMKKTAVVIAPGHGTGLPGKPSDKKGGGTGKEIVQQSSSRGGGERKGRESTTTSVPPGDSTGLTRKPTDEKGGGSGTGVRDKRASTEKSTSTSSSSSSSNNAKNKRKDAPELLRSTKKMKAGKKNAGGGGGNRKDSHRGGGRKIKNVSKHSATGHTSGKDLFGLRLGEKHPIDVLWEVEVQKSGQKSTQTEEWFASFVDLTKSLGTDANGRSRFRINYARRGNLPPSKSVVMFVSSNQLRDELQDDYEDPMLWRKKGCEVAPGPGCSSPVRPGSSGTDGGSADHEEEWADGFGMKSSRRR